MAEGPQAPGVPEVPEAGEVTPRSRVTHEITNAIVRITREAAGRGPERARVILDGDAVVVLLNETLTRAERVLVDAGRVDEVLALRRAFQEHLRPAYSAAVEQATGRRVETFMSTNHAAPDHAAEIFLLGGPADAGPGCPAEGEPG